MRQVGEERMGSYLHHAEARPADAYLVEQVAEGPIEVIGRPFLHTRCELGGVGDALLDALEGLLGLGDDAFRAGCLHVGGGGCLRARSGNDLGAGHDGRDPGGCVMLPLRICPSGRRLLVPVSDRKE